MCLGLMTSETQSTLCVHSVGRRKKFGTSLTGQDENQMLAKLSSEFQRLFEEGEPLRSLVPSIVDLFMRQLANTYENQCFRPGSSSSFNQTAR